MYPKRNAQLSLHTDASDIAIGAVLQQLSEGVWQALGFSSRRLKPTQMRYSAYDRELLAIQSTIKHFHHWIEGTNFYVLTDHKPLTYAFAQKTDKSSPRQCRQLSFISEFSTGIRHESDEDNVVPDILSRPSLVNNDPSVINTDSSYFLSFSVQSNVPSRALVD